MGAYLNYKLVNPEKAQEANKFLESLEKHEVLTENTDGYLMIHFWDKKDIEIEKEKENGVPDFFDKGEGQIKTSSCPNYSEYKHLVAEIFEKLHQKFDIKVYSGSCSLTESYFSPEEIKTITNDGKALSGEEKKKERVRKIIEKAD